MTFFAQNIQFKILDRYLKQGLFDDATKFMLRWQDAYLAFFQQQFPEHRQTLSQDAFIPFWQQRLAALSLTERPGFHFMAQKNVSDADFVVGYVFYLLALKYHKKGDEAEYKRYIDQAMAYSSFHAIRLILQPLVKPKNPITADCVTTLAETLHNLRSFADDHASPGYLVLADGYLHLAAFAKKADNLAVCETAFTQAWKYLHLARLATADSSAEINNAYFGLGLEHGTTFKFDSIEKMLDACLKLAGKTLMLPQQNFLKNEAAREYGELIKAHKDPAPKA